MHQNLKIKPKVKPKAGAQVPATKPLKIMNEKLYRKCGFYRLFFIDELRDRKYRRKRLAIRSLQRKAAELALKQFESDMKRQNY